MGGLGGRIISELLMSTSLSGYINCIKPTLLVAFCITNFPSQTIERQTQPEIEVQTSPELILNPVCISRNSKERILIEPSINSVRISISFRPSTEIEEYLLNKYSLFYRRIYAEKLGILRRKSIDGYQFSFLITSEHIEMYFIYFTYYY